MNYVILPTIEELGAELYMQPELPTVEFTRDKVKYTVTDIRLLNQVGINTLDTIINQIADNPDDTEITFRTDGVKDNYVDIVRDIVMGIKYKIEKKGRNGFSGEGSFLVSTAIRGENEIIFRWSKDHAKVIHDYIEKCQGKGESVNYYAMIAEVADKSIGSMIDEMKKTS